MIYTKYNKKVIINEEVLKEQILQNKKRKENFYFYMN